MNDAVVTWQSGRHGAEDFRIDGDGRPVTGALWLPANAAADTPLVCCGHGASGDRYQAPIPYLARRFVEECRFGVLALDGPVHGLRQRGPGGRQAFAGEMRDPAFVDRMVADWRLALQLVGAERGVGAGTLGYFGLSMGTMFGIPLLAAEPGFVVSAIGLCGSRGAAAGIGARLLRDACAIAHPVLFLMQLEDELFDREGYLELFDAVGSEDKRLHANPGLHPGVPAEEIEFACEFIAARLRGAVPRRIVNPLAE